MKMIRKRQRLSDEEYVETIRKRDRGFRRLRWIWPLLAGGMIYCLIEMSRLIGKITKDLLPDDSAVVAGLALGGIFGLLFTIACMQTGLCLKQWLDARHGFRTERLLLKYHDELRKQEASNHTSEGIRQPADGSPKPSM